MCADNITPSRVLWDLPTCFPSDHHAFFLFRTNNPLSPISAAQVWGSPLGIEQAGVVTLPKVCDASSLRSHQLAIAS